MRNNHWLSWAVLPVMLGVAGCGYYALPSPTQKEVSPAQLVGKWQYKTDFDEATITLELKSNGSFVQTIPWSSLGTSRVQKGQWSVDGSTLFLEKALRYNNNRWQPTGYTCWIIDSFGSNSPFTLFGGDGFQDDPDSGDEFERLS